MKFKTNYGDDLIFDDDFYNWFINEKHLTIQHYARKYRVHNQINFENIGLSKLIYWFNYPSYDLKDRIIQKNKNKLDFTIKNLKIINTGSDMVRYGKKASNKTSKYKGVCFRKDCNKWRAIITVKRKKYNLGNFDNELDAAIAYDKKFKELNLEGVSNNLL